MKQLTPIQNALLDLAIRAESTQIATKNFVNNLKDTYFAKKLQKYYGSVAYPDELPETFDDLIGMENEKKILLDALHFLKNIKFYQSNPIMSPYTRFLLAGAPGSGKSDLINALAKTADVPIITFDMTAIVAFPAKIESLLNLVFDFADTMQNGCVILFNNFPIVGQLTPELSMFFHNHFISRVVQATSAIVIISTASEPFITPAFYFQEKAFSQKKSILMMPPTLSTREKLFEAYCDKYQVPLAADVSFEQLARNTLGMYPKDLEYIVRETTQHVARNGGTLVTFKDFNDVMLNLEAGQMYNKLTEKERLSTAYHESGHVIAAYYSNPEYKLGRVEITPRSLSLGLTLEDAGEEKNSLFKHEMELEIIYSLGGMAAEKLIYGENSTGVSVDLRGATTLAILMYQNLGMSDDFGPAVYDLDEGLFSSELGYKYETLIAKELKRLYEITYKLLEVYKPQLEALTQALMNQEVLVGEEIQAILDAVDATAGTPKRGTLEGLPGPPKVSE